MPQFVFTVASSYMAYTHVLYVHMFRIFKCVQFENIPTSTVKSHLSCVDPKNRTVEDTSML